MKKKKPNSYLNLMPAHHLSMSSPWTGRQGNSYPFRAASLTIIEETYGRPMFPILWLCPPTHRLLLPRVDPKAKRQNRDPNWGSINTDTCPRRRRKEKFAEIGDTRAAGLHLIFAAAGNNFRCLFRSVCLIPCFSFFFRFGRTLGPAHALHQQSMSLLRLNWKNNLSVSGIILGFVFIFISSPNTRRQIISFDFFF